MSIPRLVLPLAMSAAGCAALLAAVGSNLGLFFGGIVLVTLILPGLLLAEEGWRGRAVVFSAVVLPVALIWLVPVSGQLRMTGWVGSIGVLVVYGLAVGGLACLLERVGLSALFAAAVVTVAGLLWLSWPIWMAPWLRSAHVAAWLVAPHPLLTLNGILREWYPVPWAQHVLAYPLTNLGDDVPYSLPTHIGWAVALHLPMGIGGIAASLWHGLPARELSRGQDAHATMA